MTAPLTDRNNRICALARKGLMASEIYDALRSDYPDLNTDAVANLIYRARRDGTLPKLTKAEMVARQKRSADLRSGLDIRRIRHMVSRGMSDTKIALALGVHAQTIANARKRHGILSARWRSMEVLEKTREASKRGDLASLRGVGGDKAFAELIGNRRFEDHPRLRLSTHTPKPLPLPANDRSPCGNAALMCVA